MPSGRYLSHGFNPPDIYNRCNSIVPNTREGFLGPNHPSIRKQFPRHPKHITVSYSQTSVEDVPISQVTVNDTPNARSLVGDQTSEPSLKPPDRIASDLALRQFVRFFQKTINAEGCCNHGLVFFVGRKHFRKSVKNFLNTMSQFFYEIMPSKYS